jgi:hypothetical protein
MKAMNAILVDFMNECIYTGEMLEILSKFEEHAGANLDLYKYITLAEMDRLVKIMEAYYGFETKCLTYHYK